MLPERGNPPPRTFDARIVERGLEPWEAVISIYLRGPASSDFEI